MATITTLGIGVPFEVQYGGTGLSSTTANQLLYSSSNNVIAGLATGNNSVLATNGSGVPALTTSLPSAVQVSVGSLNSGTGASSSTFWCGDGTWATVAGGVTSIAGTNNQIDASASTGAVTLSLSSTIVCPGTLDVGSFGFSGGTLTGGASLTVLTTGSRDITLNAGRTLFFASSTNSATNIQFGSADGVASVRTGWLRKQNDIQTTIRANDSQLTNIDYVWPTNQPDTDYMLAVDNSVTTGQLKWVAPPVLSLTGTANQISASPSTGAVTLSLSSTMVAPGTFSVGNYSFNGATLTGSASLTMQTGGGQNIIINAGNNVALGTTNAGKIQFYNINNSQSTKTYWYTQSGANTTSIASNASQAVDIDYFWPQSAPGSNYIMQSSSGGQMTWANITNGTGISVNNSAGTITISSNGATPTVDQSSTPVTMTANTQYIANSGSAITFNVPATAAVGDKFTVVGNGAGLSVIQMNTGQVCNLGSSPTTSGGTLTATNRYGSIEIVCTVANTTFSAKSYVETWTPA